MMRSLRRSAAAAAVACACASFCRASESSSVHYSNLSLGGGQALGTAPAAPAAVRRESRRTVALTKSDSSPRPAATPLPSPAPARATGGRWFLAACAAFAAAALALRRREGARRREGSETLALAAHELQSPLAAIESYLDLMASEAPSASRNARRWLEDLGRMRSTTAHLRRTIGDILDMTRHEDGRVKLTLRPVEVGPLLDAVAASYKAVAAARGVRLMTRIEPGLGRALADGDRLRQVLDNLLNNAIKFTPSGRSATAKAFAAEGRVVIEVLDEGVGVPADKRDRLFGKFARLGPAADATVGTGLGLYLSRRLVAAQGGRLEYEPAPAGGSLFRVTLPAARGA